jgi:hypothetical protein
VASRSSGHDSSDLDSAKSPRRIGRGAHLAEDESGAEVTVHLKVSYKTVLLVVVVFDIAHTSLREIFSSNLIENLFSLL